MPILTDDMKAVVRDHTLGYLASVDADGTPNLSPKGTFAVIDDDHIGFCEIRSPGTMANIAERPVVEVNFIDVFCRCGYRFKGPAAFFAHGTDDCAAMLPAFARWDYLHDRLSGIVRIRIERALAVSSPAYDTGMTEAELVAQNKAHYLSLYP